MGADGVGRVCSRDHEHRFPMVGKPMKTDRPASEACARCGHAREAHEGHTTPAGWPAATQCSQNDGCGAFVAADDGGGAQCDHAASADNPKICGKCRHVIVPLMGPVEFVPLPPKPSVAV